MSVHDAPRFAMVRDMTLCGLAACALLVAGWLGVAPDGATFAADGATLAPHRLPDGWVVTSLRTGGMAARSGLQVGDVIDAVAGHPPVSADVSTLAAGPVILHIAARGDVGAHSLILRPPEVASREDPDRRGR